MLTPVCPTPHPCPAGHHHSRLWASPSSASATALGAPRLRARISLSSRSTSASVRRSCSPEGAESLVGDKRPVWDSSSGGGGEGATRAQGQPAAQADCSLPSKPETTPQPEQFPELQLKAMAAHTPRPHSPAPHPLCSVSFPGLLSSRTSAQLRPHFLLDPVAGPGAPPSLCSDASQCVIQAFTSKSSQGGRVPTRGHWFISQGAPALALATLTTPLTSPTLSRHHLPV